ETSLPLILSFAIAKNLLTGRILLWSERPSAFRLIAATRGPIIPRCPNGELQSQSACSGSNVRGRRTHRHQARDQLLR
ncbi:hypothetical protein, partial [Bradyrhizobium sp. STM 3809]|uniref:hypothetical protein n=1 Tax=Bradyrhizobium sp. STM 3809 TaxID=551936 RepID=UPI001AEC0D24